MRSNKYCLFGGAAGANRGVRTCQLSLGSLSLPQPSYELNFDKRRTGRAYADYCSFIGGDAKNGVGGMSYSEWSKAPLLCFRILQNPHEYANTATVRFACHEPVADVADNISLVMFCLHSKVFEAEWSEGESNPSKVLVDEVLS